MAGGYRRHRLHHFPHQRQIITDLGFEDLFLGDQEPASTGFFSFLDATASSAAVGDASTVSIPYAVG